MTTTIATTPNPSPARPTGADPAPGRARSASVRSFEALLALGGAAPGAPLTADLSRQSAPHEGTVPDPAAAPRDPARSTLGHEIGHELDNAAQIRLDDVAQRELESPGAPDPLASQARTPDHLRANAPAAQEPTTPRRSPQHAPDPNPASKQAPAPATQSAPSAPKPSSDAAAQPVASVAAPKGATRAPSTGAGDAPVRVAAARGAGTLGAVARAPAAGVTQTAGSGSSSGQAQLGAGGAEARARALRSSAKPSDARPDGALRTRVLSQVQRAMGSIMHSKGGSLTLKLTPEHLGEVRVRVDAHEGAVRARFEARSDAARSILEDGLHTLKAALEARGVRVESLTLETDTGATRQSFMHANADQQRGENERRDARRGRDDRDRGGGAIDADDEHDEPPSTQGVWTEFGLDAIA